MSVDSLTAEQKTQYGQFSGDPNEVRLARYFHLDEADLAFISIFVLEGLLEQQTGLRPTEIMTDTAGASHMVFGLFWLLGYQFSPSLADAGEAVFWRIDKSADYGVLNNLARGSINIHRIEQHWDDMLRIAGPLKLGTIQAPELIRSLLKSDRPSSLAQAIIEVGRINKTLYLLNYIDDED